MIILVVFAVTLALIGLWLVVTSFSRRQPEPGLQVPPAKVEDGEPFAEQRGPRRKISFDFFRALFGVILIGVGAAGAAMLQVLSNLGDGGYSKGRLLRIRNRARLPRRARGDGWLEPVAAPDLAGLSRWERTVVGEAWLASARMEHASIPAFSQLSVHLTALGAPSDLVERTHLAALDEVRHARRCFGIASAYSGVAWTAGPLPELAREQPAPRAVDAIRLACGSLVDGCLGEGLAADVARAGATMARSPLIRETLEMIAVDEETHAELAWDVLAWCLRDGGEDVRREVVARIGRLATEMSPEVPNIPGVSADLLRCHGIPDQRTLEHLATTRIDRTATRALALVESNSSRKLAAA
jgi:hypothetical protein